MAKSRAEIQKAYRQRLKEKNNAQYLEKERERRRRSYVPSNSLTKHEKEVRNRKNRMYLRKYREKKRQQAQLNEDALDESLNTSGYDSAESEHLVVRMDFHRPTRANGPRMRVSRELKKTKKQLEEMKSKVALLQRKYRSSQRSMQRMRTRSPRSPKTPRSKAIHLTRNLNYIPPVQRSRIRKELVFADVLCNEIRSAAHKAPFRTKKILKNLVAGSLLRKYKLIKAFGDRTGMSRNNLSKMTSKNVNVTNITRFREVARHRENVIKFLERDDNSRNMPGKGNYVKSTDGATSQKTVLTDYLTTLYDKFISENPGTKLSFTSFCRIRPKYIQLTSLITRDTCLCTRHQNMSLTLKAVNREITSTAIKGERALEDKNDLLKKIQENFISDSITIGQWKRVETEAKGQKKMVMKIVDSQMTKTEFLDHITKQLEEFDDHVQRIRMQFKEMKTLKENLDAGHCIVHMDFSENYSCKSVQEIQSAYWNQTSVTLHPVVVYFKQGSDDLQHKSLVFISDEMGHNSASVLTIIDQLIPEIKLIQPDTTEVHYWTDSPTSQYRNKAIFHAVANHHHTFGVHAKWNYWEAGHGKGPCDGLGGTVKRMADGAVNTGKVAIQDPHDFFAWAQSSACNMKNVKFIFVSTDACQEKAAEIGSWPLKPISGTMKVHAVVGKSNAVVSLRNTSCYCQTCLATNATCGTWREESTASQRKKPAPLEPASAASPDQAKASATEFSPDSFVAAVYLGHWYIGRITQVDKSDQTLEISFLEKKKSLFQWPKRADIIWVDCDDVVCEVAAPVPSGKSKRMLSLNKDDITLVERLFEQR